MPLDGVRAWIGELERKLGARTRVGLVLVAIAVGGAGAAIYLALDTADKSASKKEVEQVKSQIGQFGGSTAPNAQLESRVTAAETKAREAQAEVVKLQAEVRALQTPSPGSSSGTKK